MVTLAQWVHSHLGAAPLGAGGTNKNLMERNNMRPVALGLSAILLATGVASAQTTTTNPPTSGTPAATSSQPAASGDNNQTVATTNANAATPASGHNSFSKGEARRRIASEGFTAVGGLRKDTHGVWRGHATKDGQTVSVWLDYKGNVGSGQS